MHKCALTMVLRVFLSQLPQVLIIFIVLRGKGRGTRNGCGIGNGHHSSRTIRFYVRIRMLRGLVAGSGMRPFRMGIRIRCLRMVTVLCLLLRLGGDGVAGSND